jgi:hypothetical protein
MDKLSYRRHRFPNIVIQQAVWLYFPYGQKIHPRCPARSRGLLMVITQEPTQSLDRLAH